MDLKHRYSAVSVREDGETERVVTIGPIIGDTA